MNLKRVLRAYPGIAELEAREQAALMERVRHQAFVKSGLVGRCVIYFLLCLLWGFMIAISPGFIFGFDSPVLLLSVVVGIVVSGYGYHWLYQGILIQGLTDLAD